MVETIQNNVDAIRHVEGVPHINHPNFQWALTAVAAIAARLSRILKFLLILTSIIFCLNGGYGFRETGKTGCAQATEPPELTTRARTYFSFPVNV